MEDFVVEIFALLSLFATYGSIGGIRNVIQKIGYNSKFFPKYYVKPNRRIAKLLGINRRLIPKHLYYEYFVVIIYVILFPISTAIYWNTNGDEQVRKILFYVYALIMGIEIVYSMICLMVYRKAD